MRLATYAPGSEAPRASVVVGQDLIEIDGVSHRMLDIIAGGQAALDVIRAQAARGRRVALTDVRLLAPIPEPPEYIGVGLNYRDHVAEAGFPTPDRPVVFNKQTSSIVGPYDPVVLPSASEQLDYEGELGVVVGRAHRNMTLSEARQAIFGYVVCNDLSVRDWQFVSPTATLGKSFDTHGPFGPWIVTADEIVDPQRLALTTSVDGEIRQRGTTADMIFGCAEILAYLSQVMTLRPGTVIATGTPSGVGLSFQPPRYLREGEVVAVEIEGLGRIENRVIAQSGRERA
jgi:2-keto-4-pentenoate hydratase/2-oxohepta-3-ene-1,7-dioic acid hydratase in catechol pathway